MVMIFPPFSYAFVFPFALQEALFSVRKKMRICAEILLYKLTDLFVKAHSAIKQKLRKREAGKIIKH